MQMNRVTKTAITIMIMVGFGLLSGCASSPKFSFDVTADMRKYTPPEYPSSEYYLGCCEAIAEVGKGAFMISPGDIDPPQYVYETNRKVFGDDYPWYPVVGNHEAETTEDMAWLRKYLSKPVDGLVRKGPENCTETTYSFDYEDVHFAVINQYYDGKSDTGTKGDVVDELYEWLKTDLEENTKPMVFVIGHEPLVSLPDADNGRHRHQGDNLDEHPKNSHRFQQLLRKHKVAAYLCGHTHGFSYATINGITQIDVGHCRGKGDKGAPSTFVKIHVYKDYWVADVYRNDSKGGKYTLKHALRP
jgi:hypothetical protein